MEKIGRLIRTLSYDYIKNNLKEADCLFIIKYSGISAPQLDVFRNTMNTHAARFLVVKNSIASRIFKSKGLEGLISMLEGPCGIVLGKGDPVAISKAIFNFAKENENLKVKGGLLNDIILSSQEITQLATLPARDILYTQLAQLLNTPMSLLVMTLKEILRRLVSVLNCIKDKK